MHVRRAAACAAAFTVLAVAPAAAHTELISSSPKDGAALSAPPDEVSLKFGEDLLAGGDKLVAEDAQGATVDLGPSTVDGATAAEALRSSGSSHQGE